MPPQTLSDAGVSEREAEVLGLLANRATNAEIAARLFVSVRTVESHVSSLLRKLGASDRRQLARLALGLGADAGDGPPTPAPPTPAAVATPAAPLAVPAPITSFVGRATEVAELPAALNEHRLVTATGPGGVGKTRLATTAAAGLWQSRTDGVWFVDLVPVSDPSLIPAAVAAALGVHDPRGRTIDDAVLAHLAERDALLVLDNCEHVSDAVAVFVERLLGRCRGVTEQFRLLTGASRLDERHGSLRSTIDWSYDLLAPVDQALLRRAAVFAAPFAADDAAAVTGVPPVESESVPDALARLADHSLLLAAPGAETLYRVLETIRQYGVERMAD